MQLIMYSNDQAKTFKEHFPVFLMGNALQTLVQSTQESKGILKSMQKYLNDCFTLSMIGKPNDHFLFYGMSRNDFQSVFNVAKFLNLQPSGLRL